jgi:uncharacterized protein YcfL
MDRRRTVPWPGVLAAAGFIAMTTLVGCVSGEARITVDATRNHSEEFYKVVSLDSDFKDKLEIESVKRRVVNGLLQVQVTLRSTSSDPLALETSWEWFDRGGFRLDDGRSAWIPIQVGARTTVEVRSVAPKAGVDAFKFHVRASSPIVGNDTD